MIGQIVLSAVVALGIIALLAICTWATSIVIAVGVFLEPYIGFIPSAFLLFAALVAGVWLVLFKTV